MDKKPTFSVGDKVRRKVGGPAMTVEEVYEPIYHYRYKCGWLEGEKKRLDLFRADELETVGETKTDVQALDQTKTDGNPPLSEAPE